MWITLISIKLIYGICVRVYGLSSPGNFILGIPKERSTKKFLKSGT